MNEPESDLAGEMRRALRGEMVLRRACGQMAAALSDPEWQGWRIGQMKDWLNIVKIYAEDEAALTRPRRIPFSAN